MKILLMMLSFLCYQFSDAQITFQKTYGVSATCGWFHSMQQTNDGGYIVIGYDSVGVNNSDMFVVKTDENGDTLWTRTYGGQYSEWGSSIQQTTDNGYILTGSSNSFGTGNIDAYLIKTDLIGDTLWTKTYGGIDEDWGYSAIQTNDGGYILIGLTFSFGAGSGDVYLIKTNSFGDTLWTNVFGGAGWDRGYYLKQTSDGGYMMIGQTNSFGIGLSNIYLIKADINGNVVWSKTYGGNYLHDAFFFDSTNDGGYIIAGRGANAGEEAYLLKIDSIGNILWNKTYGKAYSDLAYSAHQTSDNGYILTGLTTNPSTTNTDVLLIKTDSTGNMLWNNVIGGTDYERGLSVQETNDKGYIIAGETYSEKEIYLIKTDDKGNSGCNEGSAILIESIPATQVTIAATLISSDSVITTSPPTMVGRGCLVNTLCSNVNIDEQTENKNFTTVYPNPTSDKISIIIPEKATIDILNINGQIIKTIYSNSKSTIVDLTDLASGVYIVRVKTDKEIVTKKIIKE